MKLGVFGCISLHNQSRPCKVPSHARIVFWAVNRRSSEHRTAVLDATARDARGSLRSHLLSLPCGRVKTASAAPNHTARSVATLGSWNESVALSLLPGRLTCTTDGFCFLARPTLGGFFIRFAEFHLPKDSLALHLPLESPESLIYIVFANEYLHCFPILLLRSSRSALVVPPHPLNRPLHTRRLSNPAFIGMQDYGVVEASSNRHLPTLL